MRRTGIHLEVRSPWLQRALPVVKIVECRQIQSESRVRLNAITQFESDQFFGIYALTPELRNKRRYRSKNTRREYLAVNSNIIFCA